MPTHLTEYARPGGRQHKSIKGNPYEMNQMNKSEQWTCISCWRTEHVTYVSC